MQRRQPTRVLAVTGGKGGVGKTCVSINLALSLARAGQRVMLLDTDLGLANVDILLGLQPRRTLADVMSGACSLEEIVIAGPGGLLVVPGSSGIARMATLSPTEHAGLIHAFSELTMDVDYLVVDTAAGIAGSVTSFARAAQDVLVVVCDEPASLTDAYALIKVLSRDCEIERFHVVANMVRNSAEGSTLYRKLAAVTDRFLDVVLHYTGSIPNDDYVRRAIQQQVPVVEAYPGGRATSAFRQLAEQVRGWPPAQGARGYVEFFFERFAGGAG